MQNSKTRRLARRKADRDRPVREEQQQQQQHKIVEVVDVREQIRIDRERKRIKNRHYMAYPETLTDQQRQALSDIPPPFRKWLEGLRTPESMTSDWRFVANMSEFDASKLLMHCDNSLAKQLEPEEWTPHNSWSKTAEILTAYLITLLSQKNPSASFDENAEEIRRLTETELEIGVDDYSE